VTVRIIVGDALEQLRLLPADSVHCCVTSPPYYGLRDYGVASQIGLEPTPDEYIAALVAVFREVRRVLRPDGTLWANIGDSYAGNPASGGRSSSAVFHGSGLNAISDHQTPSKAYKRLIGYKPKDLLGIPWMLAFALRVDGWYLRQDIIWAKPNPMPESVTDRCTKAHEYLFLLSKNERYWFDAAAIAEAGVGRETYFGSDRYSAGSGRNDSGPYNKTPARMRNKRSVWTVASEPFPDAHFATFPPALIEPAILAGCPKGGTALDPFAGAGTTGLVADRLGRNALLIELNPLYAGMGERRIWRDGPLFADVAIETMELSDAAE